MSHPKRRSSQKRQVETRNISLPPVYNRALEELAALAGHNNASRVIQDLIAREANAQLGRGWMDHMEHNGHAA